MLDHTAAAGCSGPICTTGPDYTLDLSKHRWTDVLGTKLRQVDEMNMRQVTRSKSVGSTSIMALTEYPAG